MDREPIPGSLGVRWEYTPDDASAHDRVPRPHAFTPGSDLVYSNSLPAEDTRELREHRNIGNI